MQDFVVKLTQLAISEEFEKLPNNIKITFRETVEYVIQQDAKIVELERTLALLAKPNTHIQ